MEDELTFKGPNEVGLFYGHEEIANGKGNFKNVFLSSNSQFIIFSKL